MSDNNGLVSVKPVARSFAIACRVAALVGMSLVSMSAVSRAAALPDLDGVWLPDVGDQKRQEQGNAPPWKSDILPQVQHMAAEEKAGGRN